MFPGQGNNSYNNYGPPLGPPPRNYGPPSGPPPGNYQQDYNRPSGPPPHQYQRPQGQPQQYDRPPGQPQQYARPSGPPPTAPQNFGQNSGLTFQYSNCSGRKKALLVGVNYFGTNNELRGCINDVKNMLRFLVERWGYQWDDMVILTDDQQDSARVPTKANIIRAMQWLVKDAHPNDALVFHYLGHGGTTPDLDGDEESGFDDVIYPLDFERAGHIVDDDMHDIMVRPLPPGCRLTALYDSCHSGTALDLPYVYLTKGVVKEPNLLKDAGSGALTAFLDYERGDIGGALSSIMGLGKKVMKRQGVNADAVKQLKALPADVISISGCKDDQTSADASEGGQATGAMSWSFIKTLTEQPNQSYLSLLNNMRTLLSQKYSQKPQLSCSHPQDMNIGFIL